MYPAPPMTKTFMALSLDAARVDPLVRPAGNGR
jgi:hypothetical protein